MGIHTTRVRAALLLAGALLASTFAAPVTAWAKDADTWKIDGQVRGKPKDKSGKVYEKSNDVSGIACETKPDYPRLCLIVDDETQGVQIIILKKDKLVAGDFIRLTQDSFEGKPLDFDGEGVAYDKGAFYVMGSHGQPRHPGDSDAETAAKADASRRVFRIHFAPGGVDMRTGTFAKSATVTPSARFSDIIRMQQDVAPWADKPLAENGVSIEGIAVRDGQLYAGMRGPVIEGKGAVILSAPLSAVFENRPGQAGVQFLDLGTDTGGKARGVRDMLAFGTGLLIVAGPVNDPPKGQPIKDGDYAIFSSAGPSLQKLMDLKAYGVKDKPEALLPLETHDGVLRALLFFDGPTEGDPTPITITLP